MAVAYKLDSHAKRTEAVLNNHQNALSYLQLQDGALASVGDIVTRMSELRTMAADVTKNTGDIENYSKEFRELQTQLNQMAGEKFNGISLFAFGNHTGDATSGKELESVSLPMSPAPGGSAYDRYMLPTAYPSIW